MEAPHAFSFLTGTANIAFLDWPGGTPEQRYAIKPLSRDDIYKAAGDAEDFIREMGLVGVVALREYNAQGLLVETTYQDLAVRDEHLAKALRSAGDPHNTPLFMDADEVRRKLTAIEADKHYLRVEAHMAKAAPLTQAEALARAEEFEKLLDIIKKNPDPETLTVLPPPVLRRLICFMVAQL